MKITLIGLGISEGDLTLRAKAALDKADAIIARTGLSESFKSLKGYKVRVLDGFSANSRAELDKSLAAEVIKEASVSDVCYCVDGAVCEDGSCKIIFSGYPDCEILESVSKASHTYNSAKLSCDQPVCLPAYSVKELKSCRAACVYGIDAVSAAEVCGRLSELFGGESFCFFVHGGKAEKIKVSQIAAQKDYGGFCAVAAEEGEFLNKARYDYYDLEHIIELLRAPGGCPWDRAQTSRSIEKNLIEEAYELVDAIERGDEDGMEEETGDVLLQAAFHAVMAKERGSFTGGDAITRNVKKLIFRHSHIFGADKAQNEGEALSVWEKNKIKEKKQSTYGETLQAVPKNFPALMRAQKAGKRASKCGFDFSSPDEALKKLFEEVRELQDCIKQKDAAEAFDEAGDVLFSAVNFIRLTGVDCEEALRKSTDKFIRRFCECEKLIAAEGKDINEVTKDPVMFNSFWERAKDEIESDKDR